MLVFPVAAAACPSPGARTPTQRLDAADAAVVGRVIAVRSGELKGLAQRILTVDVDQNVKGDVPKEVVVWSPSGTTCDLRPALRSDIGLFLTRSPDGRWVATGASVVDPGLMSATGGEPRGDKIKVVVGVVLLALVILWAVSRLRRGVRPELPGGPKP